MAEDRFVHGMADLLLSAYNRHEFESLIIVAPPNALGEMRKALPDRIRDLVVTEINKDLTHLPVAELQDAVTKHLEGS
jgi:protein required for attachment to host cells